MLRQDIWKLGLQINNFTSYSSLICHSNATGWVVCWSSNFASTSCTVSTNNKNTYNATAL